jgi:hypothetical protein
MHQFGVLSFPALGVWGGKGWVFLSVFVGFDAADALGVHRR